MCTPTAIIGNKDFNDSSAARESANAEQKISSIDSSDQIFKGNIWVDRIDLKNDAYALGVNDSVCQESTKPVYFIK